VLPLSLALMATGAVLYILGRRESRPSTETAADPDSEQCLTGTGK